VTGERSEPVATAKDAAVSWRKRGLVAFKLAVAVGCMVMVSRQIDPANLRKLLENLEPGWVALAILMIALEVPLVGERWRLVVTSLGRGMYQLPHGDVHAVNGFGQFVSQVLPNLAGDGVRALMLRSHGVTLPHAAWSVLLDRALGVHSLFLMAFAFLLLPSGLESLGGYRQPVLLTVALVAMGGTLALLSARPLGAMLERRQMLRFLGVALTETHAALLGPNAVKLFAISALVHGLTILCIFALGRAIGLALPLADAAVLMVYIMVITLLPISVGGWGVRELAVTALLTAHGASAEEAVVFSVAFGMTVMLATVPGALYWLFRRNASMRAAESDSAQRAPQTDQTEKTGM